jgi:mannose-6-phosphate isomerase-like protein (cupin superfamily)
MTTLRAARTSRHFDAAPQQETPGARHWVSRGTNFVVVTTQARAGAVIEREQTEDESILLLPAGTAASVSSAGSTMRGEGDCLFILPPGASTIRVETDGRLYRIFGHTAADLAEVADNAALFATRDERVAAPVKWPEPVGGFRLRHYALKDFVRPDTTMRLFRTTTLMVNVFLPREGPRDPRKLSPHSHTDIEQGSLAIAGRYIHHMRYPWGPDATLWREDEHGEVGSPSLIVIPPTVVHTSQSTGTETSQLVDIFSPPRADFSLRPGLVCNAAEYPLPDEVAAMKNVQAE